MNGNEIASLVVFVFVVLLVVALATYPLRFKVPRTSICITVGYYWPPVLGVLVMLATSAMDIHDVGKGITGNKNIQPFGIAIIFMTLAFMCGSLDMTGLFAWLALTLTKLSKGNGRILFIFYYLLSSVITCFTSNDIVVMTLTPIICYFAAAAKADPIPFLVSEFTAANLWSMALFIGNPTNIIAAQAYDMSFIEYSKWMALPTIASGVASAILLYLMYGRNIPATIQLPDIDATSALQDRTGAVVGTALVLTCLALLAAAPSVGWPLWVVTLSCAGAHCAYNFAAYVVLPRWRGDVAAEDADATVLPQVKLSSLPQVDPPASSPEDPPSRPPPPSPTAIFHLQQRKPSFLAALVQLPWHIVPFVLGMFVLVEALAVNGWVAHLARALGKASTSTPAALAVVGGVSILLANLINNQPMTILLTRAVLSKEFVEEAGAEELRRAALFALVIGSNLGALFSVVGALAGIMWVEVVRGRGVRVRQWDFTRLMAPLGVVCSVVALVVLGLETLGF